jgi:hypothetical protein
VKVDCLSEAWIAVNNAYLVCQATSFILPGDRKPTFFIGKSGLIFFLQGDI